MKRNVITKTLTPWQGRTICISDIHGNLDLFQKLLKEVDYTPIQDRLLLLGDLVEKGNQNLDLLHYIMDLVKQGNVYCLMGNCDFTCKNVLYSYRLDFLHHILTTRKQSIIHEMANQIGLSFNESTDMSIYCQTLRRHFLKELSFLNDLPHVLDDGKRIYVHSGILNESNFGDDFKEVLTYSHFMKEDVHFSRPVVVGHMPVTEYCHHIASFDPIFDAKRNIYSIDGGNVVKQGGQLNALIFENQNVYTARVDHLPVATVIKDVPYQNQIPFFITWNHSEIEILDKTNTQYKVFSSYVNRTFWIDKEFVYQKNGIYHATDYTNYEIPLKKGDTVQVVFSYQDKVQIKRNGILGWTHRSNLIFNK